MHSRKRLGNSREVSEQAQNQASQRLQERKDFSQDREGGEAAGSRRSAKSFWQRSGLGLEDIIHGREEKIFFFFLPKGKV